MSTNLKELARRLGLSPTTVSRALSGYSDVSAATRDRVRQAAHESGYQPNPAARRLARGRADAVGIVYPVDTDFMGNPTFLEMIAGVSDRLDVAGVDVLLAVARERSELRTYERLVRSHRVDGLIVAHTRVVDERIDYLLKVGFPFVGYGRTGRPDGFAWLDFDNEAGCREAVRHLAGLGHKRIAHVHGPLELNFAQQRHEGFMRGMAEVGLAVRPEYVAPGSLDRRGGYAAGQRLLALAERPTAILVDNNLCGVGVVRALLEAGLAIGRDMSIVVNDGIPQDTLLMGHDIAAVTQPTAYESGTTMADMLLKLIEGKPLERPQVLLQPKFVAGGSIGRPPA